MSSIHVQSYINSRATNYCQFKQQVRMVPPIFPILLKQVAIIVIIIITIIIAVVKHYSNNNLLIIRAQLKTI